MFMPVTRGSTWFTEYTPFESATAGDNLRILGIGTVDLPVERSEDGSEGTSVLHLANVVHVPDMMCHVISWARLQDDSSDEHGAGGLGGIFAPPGTQIRSGIYHGRENCIACFDPKAKLIAVKLAAPPVGPHLGPSSFSRAGAYAIGVFWDDAERQRWEDSRRQPNLQGPRTARHNGDEASYTREEKDWLKRHYRGEFHFLASHGLSIYDEDDREEGRRITRALMSNE